MRSFRWAIRYLEQERLRGSVAVGSSAVASSSGRQISPSSMRHRANSRNARNCSGWLLRLRTVIAFDDDEIGGGNRLTQLEDFLIFRGVPTLHRRLVAGKLDHRVA